MDKFAFYTSVRKKINQLSAAVRCMGETVEVYGFPPGVCINEAKYPQWYFVGKTSDFESE